MALSKKQQQAAEAVKKALAKYDEDPELADLTALAKANEDGDEELAGEISADLKRRGVY